MKCRQQKDYQQGNCISEERFEMQTTKGLSARDCSSEERNEIQTTKRLSARELQFRGAK
jgi:hypothetical protein